MTDREGEGRLRPATEELDRLAAKLGRPPSALSAFNHLTSEQVGLLSAAIDETSARRRRDVSDALGRALPAPARPLVRILRGGPR